MGFEHLLNYFMGLGDLLNLAQGIQRKNLPIFQTAG